VEDENEPTDDELHAALEGDPEEQLLDFLSRTTTLSLMLDEPLDHRAIRRLSRQILRDGMVEWTTHGWSVAIPPPHAEDLGRHRV